MCVRARKHKLIVPRPRAARDGPRSTQASWFSALSVVGSWTYGVCSFGEVSVFVGAILGGYAPNKRFLFFYFCADGGRMAGGQESCLRLNQNNAQDDEALM
jgi:hypothetical protein